MKKKLEPKELRFCHEYIVDLNGAQAAIRSKFSQRSARQLAARMLSKDYIQAEIAKLKEAQVKRIQINADFVLGELYKIASFDIRELYDENNNLKDIKDLPEPVAKALSAVEVDELFDFDDGEKKSVGYSKKVKSWDKLKALEALGRHLKLFTDVIEHKGLESLADRVKKARERVKAKK